MGGWSGFASIRPGDIVYLQHPVLQSLLIPEYARGQIFGYLNSWDTNFDSVTRDQWSGRDDDGKKNYSQHAGGKYQFKCLREVKIHHARWSHNSGSLEFYLCAVMSWRDRGHEEEMVQVRHILSISQQLMANNHNILILDYGTVQEYIVVTTCKYD